MGDRRVLRVTWLAGVSATSLGIGTDSLRAVILGIKTVRRDNRKR